MTVQHTRQLYPVAAAQDFTAAELFKAITIGGTIAANPNQAIGILETTGKSGVGVSACINGITKAKAGAAINTVGFGITITTSGFIIAASSAVSIGRNLATCASGDVVPVMVDFCTLPLFPII